MTTNLIILILACIALGVLIIGIYLYKKYTILNSLKHLIIQIIIKPVLWFSGRRNLSTAKIFVWAAGKGYVWILKFYVDQRIDVNIKVAVKTINNQPGIRLITRALIDAAALGKLNTVKYLIAQGANVNVEIRTIKKGESRSYGIGRTALIEAAMRGYLEVVKTLVKHGANVNQAQNHCDLKAIDFAAEYGFLEMVKFLVFHGAYIDSGTLRLALYNKNLEIVKFLLQHEIIFGNKDSKAKILEYMIASGQDEAVELLREAWFKR